MGENKFTRRQALKYVGGAAVVAAVAAAGYGIYESTTAPTPPTTTPTMAATTTPTMAPTTTGVPAPSIELNFEVMGLGPDVQPAYTDVTNKFQSAHPNITTRLTGVPWDSALQDTQTWINAGQAPDGGFIGWLTYFIQSGYLAPLDDYIPAEEWDKFAESLMPGSLYEGKHYTIPVVSDIQMFYYRKDLLEKAGISTPPDTWDDLIAACAKVNNPPNTYAFALPAKSHGADHFFAWALWSCGGRFFDKQGQPHINSPEGIQALQWMVDMLKKGYCEPDPVSMGGDDAEGAFLAGKAAMLVTGQWFAFMIDSAKPELVGKWGIALPPSGPKQRSTYSTLNNYSIFAQSKHKNETGQLLQFMETDENLAEVAQAYQSMPPKKSFSELDYWKKDPWPIIIEAQKYAFIMIDAPEGPDYSWPAAYASAIFEKPTIDAVQKALTGTPVKQALDELQATALQIISSTTTSTTS